MSPSRTGPCNKGRQYDIRESVYATRGTRQTCLQGLRFTKGWAFSKPMVVCILSDVTFYAQSSSLLPRATFSTAVLTQLVTEYLLFGCVRATQFC